MPRRTYNNKAGRRRPAGPGGPAVLSVGREAATHLSAPSLPDEAVAAFEHRPACRGSSVTAFRGSRGDLMARCHTCGALQIAQEAT